MIRYFSLFAGIGGLEWGLEKERIGKCVGFSEVKKSSAEVYLKYWDNENYGDIRKINFKDLPDFDLLIGGFPCQSFSLAGIRKGFSDKRGKMIFYIYDLLRVKKPQFVVLENVKGLVNHNKGRTYKDIFRLLMHAGYYVRVILLNSLFYGVPQGRERIFFLCSKRDFSIKIPVIIDDSKRFRDIKDNSKCYELIKRTKKNEDKIEQRLKRNFELIGGYDRVGTLTTQYGCGEKVVQCGDWFRYLTCLECERLQGFPDNWTEGKSKRDRYWALGNAVNCNVSEYLFNNYLKGLWW